MSRTEYRSNGVPEGIDVISHGPDVSASFREGLLWDEFRAEEPELAATVAACEKCLVLRGTPSDSTTLNYLRDCIGLITYLIDQGGYCVYDPIGFRWWTPVAWRAQMFESHSLVAGNHAVILVSEEDDQSAKWFHTRGMLKFGRPDVSVHNVAPEFEDGALTLIERLIELQALGHIVQEGQPIELASLPAGLVIRHRGDLDDPDFNNCHLEVSLPR